MANLVVYVPVALERLLEEKGISDGVQREACRKALAALVQTELPPERLRTEVPPTITPEQARQVEREFRPDFGPKLR